MSLSRDDMLRELELLPMWRSRVPPVLAGHESATTLPVEQMPEPSASVSAPMAEVVVEAPSMPFVNEALVNDVPVNDVPVNDAPVSDASVNDALANEALTNQTILSDAPVAPFAMPAIQPQVTTPWLLVCPHSADADQQRLLQAIIQAMHLPQADWTLSSNVLTMAVTDCRNVILFGVEAANAFFNTTYTDVAPLRGQLHQHGVTRVVITHHPAQMLAQPLLKREVWHDLCLLLDDNASRSSQA